MVACVTFSFRLCVHMHLCPSGFSFGILLFVAGANVCVILDFLVADVCVFTFSVHDCMFHFHINFL